MGHQSDVLSPLLVLLSFSVESSNCYHLNKHNLKNTEKFFNTWCKTQARMFRSNQCPQSTVFLCHHHDTLKMRLISWKGSYFEAKNLPVKQVRGGAVVFFCLFPVNFQAGVYTRGEMSRIASPALTGTCPIFSATFLGTATFYFNAFLSLLVKGE